MPLPVAHFGTGLACYILFQSDDVKHLSTSRIVTLILIFAGLAILPDMDLLPGLLVGEPNRYHHGPSHSLLLAIATAAVIFILSRALYRSLNQRWYFIMLTLTACSHTILDYFSKDTSPPYGVPLFWPIDTDHYISPISLFNDIDRSNETGSAFIASIFNTYNLFSVSGEVLFIATLLTGVIATSRYRYSKIQSRLWLLACGLGAVGWVLFVQLIN